MARTQEAASTLQTSPLAPTTPATGTMPTPQYTPIYAAPIQVTQPESKPVEVVLPTAPGPPPYTFSTTVPAPDPPYLTQLKSTLSHVASELSDFIE